VIAERTYKDANVGLVTERARLSRRTFNTLFAGLDDCMGAILDRALEHTLALAADAFARESSRLDGIRAAFASILAFLDSEPALARAVIVESLAGGSKVDAHRTRVTDAFRLAVVQRIEDEIHHPEPETDLAMFEYVLGRVRRHLSANRREPLVTLLVPLMSHFVYLYRDEQLLLAEAARSREVLAAVLAARSNGASGPAADGHRDWAGVVIPSILTQAGAYLPHKCLRFVAHHSRSSNSDVAKALRIKSSPQVSKLLKRLEDDELLVKIPHGPGRANEWFLSDYGEEVLGADSPVRRSG
jgi:hypothetical protein